MRHDKQRDIAAVTHFLGTRHVDSTYRRGGALPTDINAAIASTCGFNAFEILRHLSQMHVHHCTHVRSHAQTHASPQRLSEPCPRTIHAQPMTSYTQCHLETCMRNVREIFHVMYHRHK